jgi:hypothetical protein
MPLKKKFSAAFGSLPVIDQQGGFTMPVSLRGAVWCAKRLSGTGRTSSAAAMFPRVAASGRSATTPNLERLKKEPDGRGFRYAWPVSQEKIMMDFDRAEASAKVTLKPRRVGRHIRVGITLAPSAAGVKEYLDRFDCVIVLLA